MFYTKYVDALHTNTEFLKIHGRTLSEENGLLLSWVNSGIEFKFKGDRCEIHFGEYTAEQPAYVKAYFDGTSQRFCLAGKYPKVLLDFEKDGERLIEICSKVAGNDKK